jgi:hypothetical protein
MATRKSKGSRSSNDKFIDGFLRGFPRRRAILTDEQREQFEKRFVHDWGVTRRYGLAFLTLSGKELVDAAKTYDTEVAVEQARIAQSLDEYAARLRDFAGFMEKAALRMNIALCWRTEDHACLNFSTLGAAFRGGPFHCWVQSTTVNAVA